MGESDGGGKYSVCGRLLKMDPELSVNTPVRFIDPLSRR